MSDVNKTREQLLAELKAQRQRADALEEAARRSKTLGETLERCEDFLNSLYAKSSMAVFVVDVGQDGSFTYAGVNPAHERAFGIKSDWLTGKTPDDLTPWFAPDVIAAVKDLYERCLRSRQPVEVEHKLASANGDTWWLSRVEPLMDRAGRVYRLVGNALDNTARVTAEKSLLENQRILTSIMDNTSDWVWSVDSERFGLIIFNTALRRYFSEKVGIDIRPGMTPDDLLPPARAGVWKEFYRRALSEGSYQVEYETLEGGLSMLISFDRVIRDGKVASISVFGKDFSARKLAEEQMRKAKEAAEQASRAKTEFLANMSHEIRTPLNGILGMLQLLQTSAATPEQKSFVLTAIKSSKRLAALLSDILDLSRLEAGKAGPLHARFETRALREAVLELFATAAKDKGLSLEFVLDERLPMALTGDEARVSQMLFNLVGNAIKFTVKGGVRVEAWRMPASRQGETRALFIVRDTGVGMTDEQASRVFEPFVQGEGSYVRRYQGAGLGLAIVARAARLLGAGLCAASAPGEGTEIYASVPFVECARGPAAKPGVRARVPAAGPGLRILFAEDDGVTAFSVQKLLEREGHRVTLAGDGREALSLLEREPFDLILMDIQMPGMDGVEATRSIRFQDRFEHARDVPIIAVTAYAMAGDQEVFLGAGMDGYVAKPLDTGELLRTIGQVMAVRAGRPVQA
jgi:PAS domain S-box-containing protein